MTIDRRKLGKRNKRMGSNAERHYRTEFIKLGYDKCQTARLASKLLDDSGVDLAFIPFNVQVKAGEQKGMKPSVELQNIQEQLAKNFPEKDPVHSYPKIVIHKKLAKKGQRRNEFMETVSMTFADFKLLIEMLQNG